VLLLLCPHRGVKYCSERVCLSVCLSDVCLSAHLSQRSCIRTSDFQCIMACGRGSIFLWQQCRWRHICIQWRDTYDEGTALGGKSDVSDCSVLCGYHYITQYYVFIVTFSSFYWV